MSGSCRNLRMFLHILLLSSVFASRPTTVTLQNAAIEDVRFPMIGLGTGGYGNDEVRAQGVYPECWSDGTLDPDGTYGGENCSSSVLNAVVSFLTMEGSRIDSSNSYQNMPIIGEAMNASGILRGEIFLTSKIGSSMPMGYNETIQQVLGALKSYGTDYIDLVLIHWPTSQRNSTDPVCDYGAGTYDGTECRLQTWKALLYCLEMGYIQAAGVSNYRKEHLQEIIEASLELPSVNQCPFNPHLYDAQSELLVFCQENNIVFNSYSPLGIPDVHTYPATISATGKIIEEPHIVDIGFSHGLTAAQVLLLWQLQKGIAVNPRSMNATHQTDNLAAALFSVNLTSEENDILEAYGANDCADDKWFECCGSGSHVGVCDPGSSSKSDAKSWPMYLILLIAGLSIVGALIFIVIVLLFQKQSDLDEPDVFEDGTGVRAVPSAPHGDIGETSRLAAHIQLDSHSIDYETHYT